MNFYNQEPDFASAFTEQCSISELYELLSAELERRAIGSVNLKALTQDLLDQTIVVNLPKGRHASANLDTHLLWLISGGKTNFTVSSRLIK